MNELVLERPEEQFKLMLYELIEEFVKNPDAELQIEMRNGDTLYLYSKDKIEFDLNLSYVKIRNCKKLTQYIESVPAEKIQVIRLDDIVSVTLIGGIGR